jgi:Protein of unknown function (DUF3302)
MAMLVTHDPSLNYFALGVLFFVVVVLFYGVIAIHDIPYLIAKGRNHPHQDAIHAAGWVSLFTLHALWPFLWIWAMAYRPERGWGFSKSPGTLDTADLIAIQSLQARIAALEAQLATQDRPARDGKAEPKPKLDERPKVTAIEPKRVSGDR